MSVTLPLNAIERVPKLSSQGLSLSEQISYASPTLFITVFMSSLGVIQGIYAQYFGLALTTISMILLIARLFDAVTDPLIGYWSDKQQSKFGTRKYFIVIGGLLTVISGYCLFVPVDPDSVNEATTVSGFYFLFWFMLLYLAWTLFEVPHLAWGSDLAPSSQDKTKIYSLRYAFTFLGILAFYLIPFLPFFETREFTPQTMQWTAIVAGMLLLPVLLFCVKQAPNGSYRNVEESPTESFWALRKEILGNKPLLLLFAGLALYVLGTGMYFTLLFIVVNSYLKLGEQFALLSIIGIICGLFAIVGWAWLANQFSKKLVLGISAAIYAIGLVVLAFLEPGEGSLIGLCITLICGYLPGIVSIAPALMGEIADYGTLKYGQDRSATFVACYYFILKLGVAVGGSISLGIAGFYGFDATAITQTDEAVFGIRLAVSWLPTLFIMLSIILFGLVSMNAHRHGIIRKRLDSRIERLTRKSFEQQQLDISQKASTLERSEL